MKNKFSTLAIVLGLSGSAVLSGCTMVWDDPNSLNPFSEKTLPQGHWQLSQIDEVAQTSSEMRLQLVEENQIMGHTGCNRFFGKTRIEGNQLYVEQIGMTKMLCSDELDKQERMLLNMLEIGVPFTVSDKALILNGKPVLHFKRLDGLE
ncbi:heat-shock protein [Pseudoalteromonas phenolica]|uniref:Heat-shock protein n=1 Tax=Pseudoalteromonas phenolica TaxID=161398 RepID=A0A5S3YUH0_9GAMM|nr:META domain-containing protein [Pseudoalteromonas phenolica]TMP81173.1 heat-shock protein [Pseudoalteromonas phenolica]